MIGVAARKCFFVLAPYAQEARIMMIRASCRFERFD
tara:strand:+ start:20370 stop:20477 length:108 start_codon:yes stop_codon:yes gene_type:complete